MGNPFGSKSQTTTTNNSLNGSSTTTLSPQVQAAYNNLLGQVANANGTNPATSTATSGLVNLSGSTNPAFGNASSAITSSLTPAYTDVSNFLSPYLSDALARQVALENQQNQQQQNTLVGNAAAQGALGGNRIGVAQAQLAGQQQLANNATNSGLINQAYQQALQAAQQQQQTEQNAGTAFTNLGSTQVSSQLAPLLGLLSAGQTQFSNLGTLGGIASQLSNSGQTVTTTGQEKGTETKPAGNIFSDILGGLAGLKGLGLFNRGGLVHANENRGLVPSNDNLPHFDAGGFVDFPYADFGDAGGLISNAGLAVTPRLPQGLPRTDDQGLPFVAPAAASAGVVPLARPIPAAAAVPQLRLTSQVVPAQGVVPGRGLGSLFAADEQAYGLPQGYLGRTAGIESNGNPNASNPSGATGLFQFMPSTARQYGLANPNDPVASANAAAALAADNARTLTRGLGRAPTPGELYLAHQQGAGGALGLLTHPDAPAISIVGRDAVVQNGGNPNMTAGQFAQLWESKFNGLVPGGGQPNAAPVGGGLLPSGNPELGNFNITGQQYSHNSPSSLGDALLGRAPMTDDQRMALLAAAGAIMGGGSPDAFANIGAGFSAGANQLMANQEQARKNAETQISGATSADALRLQGQQLFQDALTNAANIGRTAIETANARYPVLSTPYGPAYRDVTNPQGGATVVPWNLPTETSGSSIPPVQAADAEGFVTSAPPPEPGKINSMLMNPDAAKIVYGQTQTALGGAQGDAVNAQALNAQLGELAELSKGLPESGFLAQGAGFNQRVDAVRGINSVLQTMGIKPIDAQSVATAEGMKKLATQLQFAVADAVKTDPAAATIAQAASASPSGENSIQGFNRIVGNIQALNKRSVDRFNYLNDWANKHYGDLSGADVAFNEANPPQKYVAYGQHLADQLDGGGGAQPVPVSTQQQYDALPSGSLYQAPDGSVRRKQ
ncbi:MAG: transglycosylase SLT domain-containing protein [Devosia sp.]